MGHVAEGCKVRLALVCMTSHPGRKLIPASGDPAVIRTVVAVVDKKAKICQAIVGIVPYPWDGLRNKSLTFWVPNAYLSTSSHTGLI